MLFRNLTDRRATVIAVACATLVLFLALAAPVAPLAATTPADPELRQDLPTVSIPPGESAGDGAELTDPNYLFNSGSPVTNPWGTCGGCYGWSSTYYHSPSDYDMTGRAFAVPAGSSASSFRFWWAYGSEGPLSVNANRGGTASNFSRISLDLYQSNAGVPGAFITNLDGTWSVINPATHYREYRLTTPYTFTGTNYFVVIRAETDQSNYGATILWFMCAANDPLIDYESYNNGANGSTSGWAAYTVLGPCPADQNFGLQVLTSNVVGPVAPTGCISIEHPCVTVPVDITRTDATNMRAFSVGIQLTNLVLCGSGITQGAYLSSIGATDFHIVSHGGGAYTIDCAILGLPCGQTAPTGTLFNIAIAGIIEGTGTISVNSVILRDCNNVPIAANPGAPVSVTIDATPPVAVSLAAAQLLTGNDADGTTKINISFTPPSGGGYSTTDLYRKGFGNYPEYDDAPGAGSVPSIPATPAAAVAAGWSLAGSSSSGVFADEPTSRDFYYYIAFSWDGCGNVSAVSNMTGGTLNYHLGDVHNGTADCAGNNQVNLSDITFLGGHYGITLGISDPLGCLDVGPTTDWSVNARPTTDNLINFEDLIMFAINYGTVSFNGGSQATDLAGSTPAQEQPRLILGTEAAGIRGTLIARLRLVENQASVKGIHAGITYDASKLELLDVTPGALVQGETFFKHLPGESGITVDAAALGHDAVIQGSGEVAVLRFRIRAVGAVPSLKSADLRDRENRFLGDQPEGAVRPVVLQNNPPERPSETSAVPTEISFLGARPNPSSGSTELIFRLPTDQGVRIRIFDVSGRLVRTVVDRAFPAGEHAVNWDGKTDLGEKAGTGIYFCTFQVGNVDLSKKLYKYR